MTQVRLAWLGIYIGSVNKNTFTISHLNGLITMYDINLGYNKIKQNKTKQNISQIK